MTNELESETEGYDAEVIRRVWSLAQVVPGNDPEVWRKDEFGAWIHRREYRNRHSEFGWWRKVIHSLCITYVVKITLLFPHFTACRFVFLTFFCYNCSITIK